jgi:uncharacterized protein GlcG (DUF336 family)
VNTTTACRPADRPGRGSPPRHRARAAAEVAVAVSVLDAGGHLLAFRGDDRAVLMTGETSIRKAYTALQLGTPTAGLVDAVQPGGPFHTLPNALDRPTAA